MSAHAEACKKGFRFVRGEGKVIDGTWCSRFTRTASGEAPAIYIGWNQITGRWTIRDDESSNA